AHPEQRVVTGVASEQVAAGITHQLLALCRAVDERLEVSWHALRGDDMADALGVDHEAAIGLNVTDGAVSTEEVIEHADRLCRIAIDEDQQVIAVAAEAQARFVDTADEEYAVEATAGVVDDVAAVAGRVDVLVVARAADEHIVPGAAIQLVIARIAKQRIRAILAFDVVGAVTAMNL